MKGRPILITADGEKIFTEFCTQLSGNAKSCMSKCVSWFATIAKCFKSSKEKKYSTRTDLFFYKIQSFFLYCIIFREFLVLRFAALASFHYITF